MAAPFLSPNPQHIQPSRENTKRGHELLDNALSFRMPGAFAGRPRHGSNEDAAHDGGGGGGKGALQVIDGNSPPRSTPASPPRGRGRRATGAKRGRGAQRGRLGAVKLEVTPPKSRSDCDGGGGGGDGGLPSSGGRGMSQPPSPAAPPSPQGRGAGGCGGGNFLRRMSSSMSPPRRGLAGAFARVLPFGAGDKECGASPCRAIANPNPAPVAAGTAAAGAGAGAGAVGTAPRRRGGVTEGSRIDLRGLDRAKGGNQPRAYHCKDRSVVVLGRERMLSVLPDDGGGGGGGGDGGGGSGVVTWVLRYTELESCCINVSAGKESECSVGDVIVEVTTRWGFLGRFVP